MKFSKTIIDNHPQVEVETWTSEDQKALDELIARKERAAYSRKLKLENDLDRINELSESTISDIAGRVIEQGIADDLAKAISPYFKEVYLTVAGQGTAQSVLASQFTVGVKPLP